MTVRFHPIPGTILRVDLVDGFKNPEMGKRRPAVVLSSQLAGRPQLCAIVPLSTTVPRLVQPWHHKVELDPPLPFPYDRPVMWAKCDMVLTVAFHRLRLLHDSRNPTGERQYDIRVLSVDHMEAIRAGVRAALGL